MRSVLIVLFAIVAAVLPEGVFADLPNNAEQRTEAILKQMTLEEKIIFVSGLQGAPRCTKPIERLNIPSILMSNGPLGVNNCGQGCSFPAGISLAATWDTEMAKEIGVAMGQECRARGVCIFEAPGVNIYRSPTCGRNFEYLGEDPCLASDMVVPLIKGIQSQQVLATIKHFACNNREHLRSKISAEIDEQTLREIYLPAFKAAVQKANVGCIMTAYNAVNGVFCCENDFLVRQILKGEWGFNGLVMSDWFSCHNPETVANGPIDLEMPHGVCMNVDSLMPLIKEGKVKESALDEKVRRILRTVIAAGFFDRPQKDTSIPLDNPKSDIVALKGARESVVLLKNKGQLLPLSRDKVKNILVMGPNSNSWVYCAGGSGWVPVFHNVDILDGMTSVAGAGVNIICPDQPKNDTLLKMEVFGNKNLEGQPISTSEVNKIDFKWSSAPSPQIKDNQNYSVRWTGTIHPSKAGLYVLNANADDYIRVYLDDKLVVDNWTKNHILATHDIVTLEPRDYHLRVEYGQEAGRAYVQFDWALYDAVEKAKTVDAVVYCGGFDRYLEGEGNDRAFDMPAYQIQEIQKIAEVNPKVIVVLNAGGGVGWEGWLDKVPAVLHAWYSGQESGRAVAEIIFGDVNPSGKLPATFEKKLEDNPSYPYYDKDDENLRTYYKEGIFVGYRGFDKSKIEPQFCFGYGLSYTTFKVANLKVNPNSKSVEVSCDVTNTGKREGAEVVQLYIGGPKDGILRPIKELKGFARVNLMPGQTKRITISVDKSDLAVFNMKTHKWVVSPGQYNFWVGTSSRSLPLHSAIRI